jgi:YegS/Rv2252/BmrU family lipid kinase
MKYLFILNPISGPANRAHNIVNQIDSQFKSSEHKYEFAFTTGPADATHITNQAKSEDFDYIVAAGGDGTVNEVASALIHAKQSLGIIPLGSGNGIARSMHIPLKLRESIDLLLNPPVQKIDVGQVNDTYFIGVCGIGYDAQIGQKFQEFGARGPLPYFIIGIRELLIFKPEPIHLRFDKKTICVDAFVVAIANTHQYGNGAIIAPQANPQDGMLDLCIIENVSFQKAIRLSYRLFKGTIDRSDKYQHYQTNALEVEFSSAKSILHTDGEPHACANTLKIRLIPRALNVCAPANGKS